MPSFRTCVLPAFLTALGALSEAAVAQTATAPSNIRSEQELPSRYPYVVYDALNFCQPEPGFWVDLGAGKGQVTIPLIEATGNPVVMLDPDVDSMVEALKTARDQGLEQRLVAVVGVAEKMPFPDNSVDFVISRGSIFFWDDPVQGLREVRRVLRPGGKAYLGGGAGSGYPKWATDKLIEQRKQKLAAPDPGKWPRFVELRRPEQMERWAQEAELPNYRIMGEGAISAGDPRVGQGIWLLFENPDKRIERASKGR